MAIRSTGRACGEGSPPMRREGQSTGEGGASGVGSRGRRNAEVVARLESRHTSELHAFPSGPGGSVPVPGGLGCAGWWLTGVGSVAASAVARSVRWLSFAAHVSTVRYGVYVVVGVGHGVFPWQVVVDCVSAEPACEPKSLAFALECVAEVAVLFVVAAFDGHSITALSAAMVCMVDG